MSGCISPGYQCPLNSTPGVCTSQLMAYQQSLISDIEGSSIFTSISSKNNNAFNLQRKITVPRVKLWLTFKENNSAKTIYRTWIAPHIDENQLIGGHTVYWLSDERYFQDDLALSLAQKNMLEPVNNQ